MKNIKRWLSFLMALTLLLSLTVPAYAENDAGAVSTAEAEQTTAPEDPSAQPVADDTAADVVEDGYYLVGTMNNWQPSAAYKFAVNPANDKEYMLTNFTLKIGDEFKAIEVVSGNWTWYPANSGNYVVYEAQAGIVTIYFQKEYNPSWGGYLYVEKKGDVPPLPQASVETLEPEESVPLYDASGEQTGETAVLEAEYKFAAKTPTDEQKAYYGNWCADYRISFDGAVAANSIGLYGEYNGFGKEYKVGFLFPNALEKDETVDLLRLAGPEVTYNDIVDQIQEFTCGVWNTSADNIGKTITVELIIWDPAAPNTTYTVATESYTFEAPPYPEASIETIDPETGVPIFDIDTRTETGETADLEAEYKYTQAKEPTALQLAYYGSWGADFRVSFDRPVAANTVGLYGAYVGWGYDLKAGFLYPADLEAGQQVKLLTLADFNVSYNDIVKVIQEFTCGVWNTDPANYGTTITVELVIWDPNDATKEHVVATKSYTFKGPQTPELPEANVETLKPATVQVDGEDVALEAEYKFTPKDPTEEQLAYYGNWYADYRVSMDADTAKESFGLYGEYSGYGQEFKQGYLFPQALTANEPVKLLELANLSGVTYNDLVNNIGEFTCGVWNESAENIGKTITVELIIWDPNDENAEPAVISTTKYTFTAPVIPELPEANVETLKPATVQVDGEDVALEAEYKFTPKDPTEEQLAYYGNWYADYRVSMDADTAKESFGLYGEYSGYGQEFKQGYLFPQALTANEPVKLLELANLSGVTYNDLVNNIGEFTCGVWNESAENIGKTITVELIIWDPNDANAEPAVISTTKYTFTAPVIPPLPEAEVETLKPATVQVDGEDVALEAEYKFTPKDPTEEQLAYYGNWYADYRVSMDADTAKESFGLYGEYSGYGQEFKQGYLFPQALTANEPVKLLELANLSGVTYNDLVNNIGAFTCGVWNESAENIGKTITVELIIWDPNDANAEPAVISTTKYTFTAPVIPPLPEANVETLKPATVQVDGEDVDLEAEYKFTPKDPTEEQLAYYGNWYADYRVSMDADTAKESFGLYGEYSGYGQEFKQGYLFPQALTANEPVKLLELANLSGVTYNDLVNNIGEFTCGVWNESAENIGKTITVELIIWDPNDANAEPAVISTTKYTFQKPDLPTAKVETVEEPKTGVPLYDTSYQQTGETADLEAEYIFTPDNPTDLQIAYYGKWHADFRVSFDDDLAANSFGLFGAYNGYGQEFNVGFLFPQDVTKGQPIQLMELAGFTGDTAITYNDLVKNVKVFDCGVFNRSVDNIGKTITVELIIWDPQDPDTVYVVNTTSYTFQGATLELQSQDTQGNTGIAALTGGGVFFKGAEVTVTAGAANGYSFIGWHKDSAAGELVSTDAEYSFKIAEDMKLVAVYQSAGTGELHIIGSKYEVDDSGPQESSADFDKPVGKQVVLTYTGTDFLYWVNISGNIISTSEEYVFTMVGETTIRLVTSRDLESRESVYVVFLNAYDQVLSAQRILDEESAELAFPKTIPSKMGVTFEKWVFEGTDEEATPESIAARIASGNPVVKIVPKYSDPADSYTLTVKVKNGGSLSDVEGYTELVIPAGQPKTIKVADIAKAAGLEEANFSFWSLDGETADSFNKTEYTVIASKDQNITLVAVFGEAVDEEPTVAITQMYRDFVDNKYKVCVTMRYFVPEGYTVHESGFIFTGNAANVTDPDAYVIGAPGANKHISNMTSNSAIYTANLSTGTNPDKTIYLKAFVIYTDDQGEMHTIYTDLRQGSYNSLQGN